MVGDGYVVINDSAPWMNESNPEKALELVLNVLSDNWLITEEDGIEPGRRHIVFSLSRDYNPTIIYPRYIDTEYKLQ